jgi:hypothetical protein
MSLHPSTHLPRNIHTQDFGRGRLYVKFHPSLISLLDSEWSPEELVAIATDIAERSASVTPRGLASTGPRHTAAPITHAAPRPPEPAKLS